MLLLGGKNIFLQLMTLQQLTSRLRADPASKFRGGAISVIFGSQVSLRVLYCKRDDVYFATRQNGLTSRLPFSELYKIMMNEVAFVGFRGRSPQSSPLL